MLLLTALPHTLVYDTLPRNKSQEFLFTMSTLYLFNYMIVKSIFFNVKLVSNRSPYYLLYRLQILKCQNRLIPIPIFFQGLNK